MTLLFEVAGASLHWGDDSKHASVCEMERVNECVICSILQAMSLGRGALLVMISEVQSRISWVKSSVESMILVAVE